MGQVTVRVGGRDYALNCRDGEEARIAELARFLDARADELAGPMGRMNEARLLLMAGIMAVDALFDLRERTERAAERVEALAAALEEGGTAP